MVRFRQQPLKSSLFIENMRFKVIKKNDKQSWDVQNKVVLRK